MRAVLLALTLLTLGSSAAAERRISGPAREAVTTVETRAALDALFARLARAGNALEARKVEGLIWLHWLRTPDRAAARALNLSFKTRAEGDFPSTLAEVSQVTDRHPDYAEGWNQRATALYLLGRDDEALADCERVLALEPRHFGCLSGMALIHIRNERPGAARAVLQRAVTIHPFLPERRLLKTLPGTDL